MLLACGNYIIAINKQYVWGFFSRPLEGSISIKKKKKKDMDIIPLVHTCGLLGFFPKLLYPCLPPFRYRVSFHIKTTEMKELNSYLV